MMDDDAWKDYTDETLEQLKEQFELAIEFKRRARFLRSQELCRYQEAKRKGFRSVDEMKDWVLKYQAMRARFGED